METALLLLCPSPSSRMAPRRGDARPPGWCDAAVCTVLVRAVDFSRLYTVGARAASRWKRGTGDTFAATLADSRQRAEGPCARAVRKPDTAACCYSVQWVSLWGYRPQGAASEGFLRVCASVLRH